MTVARPIPHWFRTQFVNRRTKRLSPKFFWTNKHGLPRKPFAEALKAEERGTLDAGGLWALWAFTPFLVDIGDTGTMPEGMYEHLEAWLAAHVEEPWFWFLHWSKDQPRCSNVIGFHSKTDAALFRLYMPHLSRDTV